MMSMGMLFRIKLFLMAACFYGSCVYGDVADTECFGESISLDETPGSSLDFYARFESDVAESRKAANQDNSASCAVVSSINETSGAVFVDVRKTPRNTDFAINDIINIPFHELRTKDFLKKADLVLFDDAFRFYELLEECESLKTWGFKHVSVFGGAVNSTSAPVSAADYIDPRDFYVLKQKWRWLVFDLSGNHGPVSRNIIFLNPKLGKTVLVSEIKKGIESFRTMHGFDPHVLFMDQSGRNYSSIQDPIMEKNKRRFFYLIDGLSGYRNFVLQHYRIIEQKKHIDSKGSSPCAPGRS